MRTNYAILCVPVRIVEAMLLLPCLLLLPPQLEGVAWLVQQHQRGLNSILADEMGLGKTLQTIAFIAHLKYEMGVPGPHLVVVPLSVMSSWMAELAK